MVVFGAGTDNGGPMALIQPQANLFADGSLIGIAGTGVAVFEEWNNYNLIAREV